MKIGLLICSITMFALCSCKRDGDILDGPCQGISPQVNLRIDGLYIVADIDGGAPPFKYSWSNGATASSLYRQPTGNYELSVIDANGCPGVANIDYDNPCDVSTLKAWIVGGVNSAELQIFGGQSPYDIIWSNGATMEALSNLPLGTLSVTVTDAGGCVTFAETLIGAGCQGETEVTDIDGNVYQVVEIGGQCWTTSNLRTLRFNNGAQIVQQQIPGLWGAVSSSLCAQHPDNDDMMLPYGILYNWFAAADQRGLCPTGWHMPSDLEWEVLEATVGGAPTAGMALKAVETWYAPNSGVSDAFGFGALAAGRLNVWEGYELVGAEAHFWSSTRQGTTNSAWQMALSYEHEASTRTLAPVNRGHSVRCVKD